MPAERIALVTGANQGVGLEVATKLAAAGVTGTIRQLDFFTLDSIYDIVFSAGVVEHFEDPSVPLAAFVRLVVPGGILITDVPNLIGLNGLYHRVLKSETFRTHRPIHLAELRASIGTSQVQVDRLSREKKRWKDPAYVKTIAHQRFGWVMPGEIGFQVLDKDGKPLDPTDTLPTPRASTEASRPLWWQSAWGSVVESGKTKAERTVPPPAAKIDAPKVPAADKAGD